MIAAMANDDRRPGDSDMHRRQRGKNLFMLVVLLVIVAVFFALTMVRMGGTL
jgi:Tfp pilus assembly protein PilX